MTRVGGGEETGIFHFGWKSLPTCNPNLKDFPFVKCFDISWVTGQNTVHHQPRQTSLGNYYLNTSCSILFALNMHKRYNS